MSSELEKLTFEVEKITGKQLIPVVIDKRIYYIIPISVFLLLLIARPNFLYKKDKEEMNFKIHLLIWYTLLISIIIIGLFFAYKYRRFF
jgi:hypothetical protein